MEPDEPVPFSEFDLKGSKDKYLRRVLRRLGKTSLGYYNYKEYALGKARIWLSDVHNRWESLLPDVKSRLVSDLLDALYRRKGGFDVLFEILFLQRENMGKWQHVGYSSTAVDIIRSFGMEHSFHVEGQYQNILDFPLWNVLTNYGDDDIKCLGRSIGRPLYVSFFLGRSYMVRLLLNSGASLMTEEFCRLVNVTSHRYTCKGSHYLFAKDDSKRQQDLVSLELILVDATQRLRSNLRSKFLDAVEEIPSLKHVARACVRQCLRNSRTIGRPDALRPCGLPKSLESYIYMEDIEVDA